MTPAERLRAAADRLAELDEAASRPPWVCYPTSSRDDGADLAWTIGRPYCLPPDETCEPDCGDTVLVTGAEGCEEDHITGEDVALIVTLRPLAPWAAAWLRSQATDMDQHLAYACKAQEHCTPDCGLSYLPDADPRCTHYDDALALADAILGPAAPDPAPAAQRRGPGGDVILTAIYEDGQQVGVRVDHADDLVLIHPAVLDDDLGPGITFDGTAFTVEAVNGTWQWILTEDAQRADGGRWARLVESPAVEPLDPAAQRRDAARGLIT